MHPQMCEITRTPAAERAISNGQEIAPQISTSAGSRATSWARLPGSLAVKATTRRPISPALSTSTSKRFAATSKTGDTRPCHWGIAILINTTLDKWRASATTHPFCEITEARIDS